MAATDMLSGAFVEKLPSGTTVVKFIIVFIVVIIVMGMLGYLIYLNLQKRKFNKKVVLFRKVGGKIIKVGEDLAAFERIGVGGDFWCKVRKLKKIVPRPRIQMDNNTFWFYEREDGEWINIGLEDIDLRMKEFSAYFVDEDMRLQRLGIQKNLQQRLQKLTFFEKYGAMLIFGFFVLIVTVCLILLFQRMEGAYQGATQMASSVKSMAISVDNLATRSMSGLQYVG